MSQRGRCGIGSKHEHQSQIKTTQHIVVNRRLSRRTKIKAGSLGSNRCLTTSLAKIKNQVPRAKSGNRATAHRDMYVRVSGQVDHPLEVHAAAME